MAEQGDAFSLELFYDAGKIHMDKFNIASASAVFTYSGKMLARHIIAISCYFDKVSSLQTRSRLILSPLSGNVR